MCDLVDRTFFLSGLLWTKVRFKPKIFSLRKLTRLKLRNSRGHRVTLVQDPDIPVMPLASEAFHCGKPALIFGSKVVNI